MIEALLLGRQHGYPRLKAVIEKALDMSCFDVEAVRLHPGCGTKQETRTA
jgi:hypothetical protein